MLKRFSSPAWAVLEYAWYPFLLLATTPWFLQRLGTDSYGYWMLLTATTGFGAALNAGTGIATIKAVSGSVGRGESCGEHVRTALGVAMFGGGVLALLILSSFWVGGSFLLGRMGSDSQLVRITGVVAAALLWLEQIDNVISSALKGAERFGSAARLEMLGKAIQIALALIATWYWPTLGALYLALLVGALLRLAAKLRITRKLLSMNRLSPTLTGAAKILHVAGWGWLQGIGGVLFGVVDRMLIGAMLGASSLAYYSIASQLAMQVHALSAAALSVVFPMISRQLEGASGMPLTPLARRAMGSNLLLSSAFAIALLALGPWFVDRWLSQDASTVVKEMLPWLVGAYWLLALNVAPFYILLGVGRHRVVGLNVFCAGCVGIVALIASIKLSGANGVAAGRIGYALGSLGLLLPLALYLRSEWRERLKAQASISPTV